MSSAIFSLNRPNGVYFEKDVIEGTVTLTTTKPKYIKDIKMNFNGRAKVLWETDDDVPRGAEESDTPRCIFRGEETFCDENLNLNVLKNKILRAGTYNFNFKFDIKPDCPTSCEGRYGHVRYELSLVIDRIHTYSNVFKHAVTVIRKLDLNLNRKYTISPIETINNTYNFKSCLCFLANIYFTLKTRFCAYTPGQNIGYDLELHSHSRDIVLQCDVQLIKKMVFTAKTPSNRTFTTKSVLVKHLHRDCQLMRNNIHSEILVPPTPPTSSRTDLVYVKYYLQAQVDLNCCMKSKLIAKHDITIGTEPLVETLPPNEIILLRNELHEIEARGDLTQQKNEKKSKTAVKDSISVPFLDSDSPSSSILYHPLYPVFEPYK